MDPISLKTLTEGRFIELLAYANRLAVENSTHPLNAQLLKLWQHRIQDCIPANPCEIYFKHLPFEYLESLVTVAADKKAWSTASGALQHNLESFEPPYPDHRGKIARLALDLVDRAEEAGEDHEARHLLRTARVGAISTGNQEFIEEVYEHTFQFLDTAFAKNEVDATVYQLKELYLETKETAPAIHARAEQKLFEYLNRARGTPSSLASPAQPNNEALERLYNYGTQMFPADSKSFEKLCGHALTTVDQLTQQQDFACVGAILAHCHNHSPKASATRLVFKDAWRKAVNTAIASSDFDAVRELISSAYREAPSGFANPDLARPFVIPAIGAAVAAHKPNRATDLYHLARNNESADHQKELQAQWEKLLPKVRAAKNLGATTPNKLVSQLSSYLQRAENSPSLVPFSSPLCVGEQYP